MRSTRHKFKMLRGISRSSSTNGGDGVGAISNGTCSGLPYRKQVHYQQSANFQRHSSADSVASNNSTPHKHTNTNQSSNGSDPNISTQPPHRSHSDGQVNNGSGRKPLSPHHQRLRPYNQHPTPFIVPSSAPLSTLITINTGESNNNKNNLPDHIQSLTWSEIHSSTTSTMDCELNSDIRAKAFAICKDYLHGVWKQIDARDLVVKRISGGLSNYLYHCSLPPTLSPLYTEPIQVLLRFYGQVHGEGALESLITESVIFTLLSERKLGPRLYGVFPGGRVEEFIPARPLLTVELRDEELTLLIAQKMAQIHALNIPISKEPSWLWGTMDRWMANVQENLSKISLKDNPKSDIIRRLKEFNLAGELSWLRKYLPKVDSPVVFSHNDLQEGNILIRPEFESADDKLVLIDFEYCSYNYRGFDLANHFCEWSYNYNVDLYPNFAYTPMDLPTREEKIRFVRRYIHILREEYKLNFPEVDDDFLRDSSLFDEKQILREIEAFVLASHLFWSLWAIVNAQVSKIPFGYWEYGLSRLETYFEHKQRII